MGEVPFSDPFVALYVFDEDGRQEVTVTQDPRIVVDACSRLAAQGDFNAARILADCFPGRAPAPLDIDP